MLQQEPKAPIGIWRKRARSLQFNSSFLRAIATLSAGQILAAIIPLLAAPILGRIFHPEDYGLLASYTAIVNVSASVVTLHYQHGVLTEKTESRAHQMALLSLLATAGVAALMIPVAVGVFLLDPFGPAIRGHRVWFLLLPLSTMVIGSSLVAMAVANRARSYRQIAVMQFSAAGASALSSIVFGLAGLGSDGLFLAYLLSQVTTFLFSIAILLRHRVHDAETSLIKIRSLAIKHGGYPAFTMPAVFIQSIGLQLPVFTLTYLGETSLLGSFSRAQSLLILPVTLLSGAVSRVYFQRVVEDYNRTGTCKPLFLKTVPLLFALALPFLLLFGVFGPSVFTLYLGKNWSEAGRIAQILAPVFFVQMFVGPLGSAVLFSGNQRLSVFVHGIGFILAAIGCSIPILGGMRTVDVIIGWAVAIGILNIIQIWLGWELSSTRNRLSPLVQANRVSRTQK